MNEICEWINRLIKVYQITIDISNDGLNDCKNNTIHTLSLLERRFESEFVINRIGGQIDIDTILYKIESLLISADEVARKAILSRIIRLMYVPRMLRKPSKVDNTNGYSILWDIQVYAIFNSLQKYFESDSNLPTFCYNSLMAFTFFSQGIDSLIYDFGFEINEKDCLSKIKENQEEGQYKKIPRTHAIAALKILLTKLNVYKKTDKTVVAEFIEAVTGGNITKKGKDTMSYKKPEKTALLAAKELLGKIGVTTEN